MQFLQRQGSSIAHNSPLSPFERVLLILAIILMIIGIIGYAYDRQKYIYDVPISSGTYTEGVIDDSPTKIDRMITHLTNIGLTYRENDGSIKPALTESWTVSDDKKIYNFHIRPGFSASNLLTIIHSSKNSWTGINIESPDENTLRFSLKEPSSLFLSTTTQQLFPHGPYEVAKRDKQETILRTNSEFPLGKTYIPKIIIKSYPSEEQLIKAAEDGEINGSADFKDNIPKGFIEQELELPRYHVLIFNMIKPIFKNIDDRKRVVNQTDGNPITYTLLTSQTGLASDLADELARNLATKNITLTIQKKTGAVLQKEDIAKREFDLLLYGINYGATRDYYPFWHSSQAGSNGLNISGVKDRDLDHLLETARNEPDDVKRLEYNKQIETFLEEKGLQKTMSQEKYKFWINKSVKGVKYATIDEGNDRFNLMWQWYFKSKKMKTPQN